MPGSVKCCVRSVSLLVQLLAFGRGVVETCVALELRLCWNEKLPELCYRPPLGKLLLESTECSLLWSHLSSKSWFHASKRFFYLH